MSAVKPVIFALVADGSNEFTAVVQVFPSSSDFSIFNAVAPSIAGKETATEVLVFENNVKAKGIIVDPVPPRAAAKFSLPR